MALGKNLEALLALMGKDEAAAQRKIWEDNPAMAAAVEKVAVPQDVFNRELNSKEEEVKRHKKSADEWKDWSDKNVPKHKQALQDLEKAGQENKDLQERIERLSATEGGNVDEEKLMERVEKRIGGKPVSEARLSEIVAAESKKMQDAMQGILDQTRKDFLEKTFPAVTSFQADLADVMSDYKDEFGKKLDRAEFSKFMQEHQVTSPRQAFEMFTAKDREEKRIKTEVDKQVAAEMAKRNMPGVSSGEQFSGDGSLGPLQLKIAGETPKFPEGSELGDKSAANMAAAELRQQGAF